jgi:hypothetical protein
VARHHNLHLHLQASRLCSFMDMNNIHIHMIRQECLCLCRSIACARTGRWCSPMAPRLSLTPSSTAPGERSIYI